MEPIVLPKSSNLLKLPEQLYGTIKRVGILNKEPILYGDVNLLKPNDLYYISGAKQVYRYVKAIIGSEQENPSDSLTVEETSGITYLFTTVKPISIESMSDGFSLPEEQLGWVSRAGYLFNQIIYTGDANLVNNGNLYYNNNYPFISIIRFDESDNQVMLYTKYIDDNGDSVTSMVEYKNGKAIPGSCSWEVTIPEDDNVYEEGDTITIPITVKNTGDQKLSEIAVRVNFSDGTVETLQVKDLSEDESSTIECTYTVGEEDVERGSSTVSVDFYATAQMDGLVEEENAASVTYNHSFENVYLTFEALEDGTFTLNIPANIDSNYMTSVSYSTNNGKTWTTTTIDNTAQTITTPTINAGDKVLWKGVGKSMAKDKYDNNFSYFSSTGNFNVSGNIMSLLYGDKFANQVVFPSGSTYNFCYLFRYNNKLISAENLILPATTLKQYCYYYMFNGCSKLTTAPELPATTLAKFCYASMFFSCTSLATSPELPATTLASNCYDGMFNNCTSLTTAPELPATTLASNCYASMFSGTSLTTAPVLPATTLAMSCYQNMFRGCSKLNYIKAMFTTEPSITYTSNWVQGVAASGTFVKNSAATWTTTGNNAVPSGWTVETASS